jgi:flagellar biosynthesis protein FlhB
MVLSKINSKEEIDNPSSHVIARFIHSNSSMLVRATQFTAILSYIVFADSSLQDVVTSIETFPRFDKVDKKSDKNVACMVFSCLLRLIQGSLAIIAALMLVITASDVIEIILNFTAINYISTLDGKTL